MSGRAWLLVVVVILGILWGGGQAVYVWATNRHPAKMTCAEYVAKHPSAKWLELTDCEVDYLGAIQLSSRVLKVDKGTFVPVRSAGDTGRAHVLMKMDTEAAERRVAAVVKGESGTQAREVTTVTGMVVFGIDSNDKARRALLKEESVASDFVILDPEKKPDAGEAAFGAAGIAGVVVFLVWRIRRALSVAAPVEVAGSAQTPPPLPPRAGS